MCLSLLVKGGKNLEIDKAIHYFILSLQNEQLSIHTVRAYEQDLNQFHQESHKERLEELSFEDFGEYFYKIAQLKPTSIKRKRVVIHRFLDFCYRKKLCQEDLTHYIDPIRSKKNVTPKEVLTKEEINKILLFLQQEQQIILEKRGTPYYDYLFYCTLRNQLLVSFLLYTGCRANEVVSVKKKDIDFEKNSILLLTKGNKFNTVPIHDKLLEAFRRYEQDYALLSPSLKEQLEESPFLFPSKENKNAYMATRTLHDLMKKLSKAINRKIHAHLFRHTFASYCIAANMDIATISSLISHSNPSITLSIYTHEIDAHNKQEQIKKLSFD